MYSSVSKNDSVNPLPISRLGAHKLINEDAESVLRFLPKKPAHCAYLRSLIQENGLTSPLNRGTFYGSRNFLGELQGVALIGHATILEPTNHGALRELAEASSQCKSTHLILCEDRWADGFWTYYTTGRRSVEVERSELLLELRWPTVFPNTNRPQLRLATVRDLELLIPVHARLAQDESGVDPREVDRDGFIERYHQRILNGRTWVLIQDDQLVFKAEVVTATEDTCYLEGVWVSPGAREQGYGRACITELARMLLWRSRSLSLLINADKKELQSFYRSCGFHVRGSYRTAFLKQRCQ